MQFLFAQTLNIVLVCFFFCIFSGRSLSLTIAPLPRDEAERAVEEGVHGSFF